MIYWDTSAVIRFILDRRMDEISGVTRTHTLAELFSAFTGRGWQETMPGGVTRQRRMGLALAAKTIRQVRERLDFIELDPDDVVSALDGAKGIGAQGAAIHDLLHARAAEKAKATEFWTTDRNDFERLLTTIPIKQLGED
jgi:predicted nucleic acid-binding protein